MSPSSGDNRWGNRERPPNPKAREVISIPEQLLFALVSFDRRAAQCRAPSFKSYQNGSAISCSGFANPLIRLSGCGPGRRREAECLRPSGPREARRKGPWRWSDWGSVSPFAINPIGQFVDHHLGTSERIARPPAYRRTACSSLRPARFISGAEHPWEPNYWISAIR